MSVFIYHEGRLEGFGSDGASPGTWRAMWQQLGIGQEIESARRGDSRYGSLNVLMPVLVRHLPVTTEQAPSAILEAGCGTGHVAVALRARGYRALGLDFDHETLAAAGPLAPECHFVAGDVFKLPFRDRSLAAYVSIGVVEHYRDGPMPILAEALRVLRDDGVALISVPYLNPVRHLRAIAGAYPSRDRADTAGLAFWQYVYSPREFSLLLREAGFHVMGTYPHEGLEGAWRDVRGFKRVVRRLRGTRVGEFLLDKYDASLAGRWLSGHMMLFAARKG